MRVNERKRESDPDQATLIQEEDRLLSVFIAKCSSLESRTVSGIEGSHALGRNLENVTSGVLWTGHVMLAWVTLPGCFKQIQNRGFKPAMMGDLRPAKPGCSLVPHKAENRNVEGEGREQLVQRDGQRLMYLVFTKSALPVPELQTW